MSNLATEKKDLYNQATVGLFCALCVGLSMCKHCAFVRKSCKDCLLCSTEVGGGMITNQCAVGELNWCEVIHIFALHLTLHTMELKMIPTILHLVYNVNSELIQCRLEA